MAAPSKTAAVSLLALQNIAASGNVAGSAYDASVKFAANVMIHFGRKSSTAYTTAPTFRIEQSAKASGDGFWFPMAVFSPTLGALLTAQAVNGTCNAGQNVIAMTSTTNFSVGDVVYVSNGTLANSEWGRVKSVSSNTSITLEDNLLNAQTGSTVYKGEMFLASLDLAGVTRLRLVDDNSGNSTAGGHDIEAFIVSLDSIG